MERLHEESFTLLQHMLKDGWVKFGPKGSNSDWFVAFESLKKPSDQIKVMLQPD